MMQSDIEREQSALVSAVQEALDRLDKGEDPDEVAVALRDAYYSCSSFDRLAEGVRVAYQEALNRAEGTAVPLDQMTTP